MYAICFEYILFCVVECCSFLLFMCSYRHSHKMAVFTC